MGAPAADIDESRLSIFVTKNGARKATSVEAFRAIPLTQRVRLLLAGNVEFLLDGEPLDAQTALGILGRGDDAGPNSSGTRG